MSRFKQSTVSSRGRCPAGQQCLRSPELLLQPHSPVLAVRIMCCPRQPHEPIMISFTEQVLAMRFCLLPIDVWIVHASSFYGGLNLHLCSPRVVISLPCRK
jgi:hypothetical protein